MSSGASYRAGIGFESVLVRRACTRDVEGTSSMGMSTALQQILT